MDPSILQELRARVDEALAAGRFSEAEVDRQTTLFRENFGPQQLQRADGEALLRVMHGRREDEPRCMMYWLEFKNDDEFSCKLFGGVGGGSALKFGLYNKEPEGLWLTGSPTAQRTISQDVAIELARQQREELVAGAKVLSEFDPAQADDERCSRLDQAMRGAAPNLYSAGWAHKYWFLIHPDRLDTFHSPQYQRFHLLKLREMPPDRVGILDPSASRFACTGRFLQLASELKISTTILGKIIGERSPHHRYWKVGTTSGSTGETQWPVMREGAFVSIGWTQFVPDLSARLQDKDLKSHIAGLIESDYNDSGTAKRKAGEITNFVKEIAVNDLVLACEGATVLGIGRVTGPYEYRKGLAFPHVRPVEWLSLDSWKQLTIEGPRTTVYQFGKDAQNVLAVEERVNPTTTCRPSVIAANPSALPPLDPWSVRVETALKRKGQVILYGPPGTGKTFRALAVAKELAARQAFRKPVAQLSDQEHSGLLGIDGLVRVCTFHPNWGYEDFLEGIRPTAAANGVISFAERDGLFKRLCADAVKEPGKHFYLVVDEINRGDIPRIFGELLTVIELDKRDQPIRLPVSGRSFSVPKNVFIVGTMNTADRSISLLDAALRRRFAFIELMPDSKCLTGKSVDGIPLSAWLDALNARLRKHLKRDARNLQVGHAYLMPAVPITSFSDFARVLRDDIIPLIEEYCYDDFGTLQTILGKDLVDLELGRINEELFLTSREEELKGAVFYEEMASYALAEELDSGEDSNAAEGEEDR
jgi:5-methylcytosine-specific restriction enzyme B